MSGTIQPMGNATMTVASGRSGVFPVGFGYYPQEGSRCVSAQYNWSTQTGYGEDLSQLVARGVETSIQSVFVDNSTCPTPVTILVAGTQQVVICPPLAQGTFPLFFTGTPNFQITTTALGNYVTRLYLLNVPGAGAGIWSAVSASGGSSSSSGSSAFTGTTLPAYTGFIATRSYQNTSVYNGASAATMSRTYHYARDNITPTSGLKVGYSHWYTFGSTVPTVVEQLPSANVTLTGSIEYPAGVLTQLKWGGNASVSVAPGTTVFCDTIPLTIPYGAKFYLRRYIVGTSWCFISQTLTGQNAVDVANGDATNFVATDLTMSGTVTDSGSQTFAPPCAIIGTTTRPSIALIGDSRVQGAKDTVVPTIGDLGDQARSVGKLYAYCDIGIGSDTAQQFCIAANSSRRCALASFASDVVISFGINDTTNSNPLATIQANLGQVYGLTGIAGKTLWQTTISPGTTSSDNWTTLANQAAFSTDAVRVNLNTWIRTIPSPLKGIFDICTVTESAVGSGKWSVTGAAFGVTADGVHASPNGCELIMENGCVNPLVFV